MNESEKMLNIIHKNNKRVQQEEALEEYYRELEEEKEQIKEQRHRKIEIICLVIALISMLILGYLYNEKSVKGCMESGHTETFCRYAGE